MRKFLKQITLLGLGVTLFGLLASRANAVAISGPLEDSSSYAFSAIGDDTAGSGAATMTMAGSLNTDSSGFPVGGFIVTNDNGSVCHGTFTSSLVPRSPANTGTMVWTLSQTTPGCFATVTLHFAYANASDFSDVMYFSSNGADPLSVQGKIQEFDDIDRTIVGAATAKKVRKHK